MILFVFVPGFYAAVEQADHPELRGRPTLVGGDPRKRGVVTSASVEAAAKGVQPGMPMSEALERCPGAAVRATRLRRYREVSAVLRSIGWRRTERLEPSGLEGLYLELEQGADPVELAAELCLELRSDHRLPAVAGIGPTRFVANVAARHAGPGGIRVVERDEAAGFLDDLPVSEIWGLGPATAARLAEEGIRRIGELRARNVEDLERIVGRLAATFHRLAVGSDDGHIRPRARPKTISQEATLPEPTADLATLGERISELCGRLAGVLAQEQRAARTVTLGIGFLDDQRVTRGQTDSRGLETQAEIREVALSLLGRAHPAGRLVRRVRVQLGNLYARESTRPPRQLSLF